MPLQAYFAVIIVGAHNYSNRGQLLYRADDVTL
jgi:hypothetical protein